MSVANLKSLSNSSRANPWNWTQLKQKVYLPMTVKQHRLRIRSRSLHEHRRRLSGLPYPPNRVQYLLRSVCYSLLTLWPPAWCHCHGSRSISPGNLQYVCISRTLPFFLYSNHIDRYVAKYSIQDIYLYFCDLGIEIFLVTSLRYDFASSMLAKLDLLTRYISHFDSHRRMAMLTQTS